MKRIVDVFLASMALLALWPMMLAIGLLIRVNLGSPVIFSQIRPGFNSKPFRMYKFRTMSDDVAEDGLPLPDMERLGRLGSVLRATSLDELPTIWNVLKGEMSIVGPRPLLIQYLPLYSQRQKRRMDVRPGITGWAQVNGRNSISWADKFELDVWYIEHQSFFLDVRIIWMTIVKVLQREGINASAETTCDPFNGNDREECL